MAKLQNAAAHEDRDRERNAADRTEDLNGKRRIVNESTASAATENVTISVTLGPPAEDEKSEWDGGLEFLMACIASSVGLGNIWRFPFTAYENGGGAFLIPYIIVLIFIGKPFYFLEGSLGQFTGRSCGKTWSMCPAMTGIGYGQVITAFYVLTYYCSLMALTAYYLIASCGPELPWSHCRSEWNGCIDARTPANLSASNKTLSSPAEIYFRTIVLNEYDTIDEGIGWPSWKLFLCLAAGWIVIFGILCRGVKSTGKAAYFLAIFPYTIMIALLVRAVTLEGAVNGILFFITPKWDKLWEPTVWYAAITQCFFSLAVCFGPILTYSSHNKFRHRVDRDVMIVTTLDTFTSLMAGCTIFGILGNLAHEMGTDDVSSIVRGGTGLAFISYPDALSRFVVVPQLFSVMFFFMMFVLGAGSAMALGAGILGVLSDHFPNTKQWKMTLVLCIVGCLAGLVYVTPGGQWFVTLVDYYGGTFVAIIVGVLQMTTVFWIYGLFNFLNDIEFMLSRRPGLYWRICWTVVTPVFMITVLIYTIATYVPPTYDDMAFPVYAYAIGWIIFAISIVQIFGWIVAKVTKNRNSSFTKAVIRAFAPSAEWGPRDEKIRKDWNEFVTMKKSKYKGTLKELYFG